MRVELDPAQVRDYMDLWREALDFKIAIKDDLKIHLMNQRRPILENYLKTATSWTMLLLTATASGEDELDLAELRQDVVRFKEWAQRELAKLDAL